MPKADAAASCCGSGYRALPVGELFADMGRDLDGDLGGDLSGDLSGDLGGDMDKERSISSCLMKAKIFRSNEKKKLN